MRATLNIPDGLIEEVQKITGARTKTEAIVISLKEVIRKKRIENLLAMRGKVEIEDVSEEMEKLELKEMEENDKRWRDR